MKLFKILLTQIPLLVVLLLWHWSVKGSVLAESVSPRNKGLMIVVREIDSGMIRAEYRSTYFDQVYSTRAYYAEYGAQKAAVAWNEDGGVSITVDRTLRFECDRRGFWNPTVSMAFSGKSYSP